MSATLTAETMRAHMHSYWRDSHPSCRTVRHHAMNLHQQVRETEDEHQRASERVPFRMHEQLDAARLSARRYRPQYAIGWRPSWPGAALVPWLAGPAEVLK